MMFLYGIKIFRPKYIIAFAPKELVWFAGNNTVLTSGPPGNSQYGLDYEGINIMNPY